VSSLPLQNVGLLWKFFYINICSFISRDKFLYEIRVIDNTYLCFKVQLPTFDSTEITAGGPKITLGIQWHRGFQRTHYWTPKIQDGGHPPS